MLRLPVGKLSSGFNTAELFLVSQRPGPPIYGLPLSHCERGWHSSRAEPHDMGNWQKKKKKADLYGWGEVTLSLQFPEIQDTTEENRAGKAERIFHLSRKGVQSGRNYLLGCRLAWETKQGSGLGLYVHWNLLVIMCTVKLMMPCHCNIVVEPVGTTMSERALYINT